MITMIFQLTTLITLVYILDPKKSEANPHPGYKFIPQDHDKGRVIFYRSIGSRQYYPTDHREPQQFSTGYNSPDRDVKYYRQYNNYRGWPKQFNLYSNTANTINDRTEYGYRNNFNRPRNQNWRFNREKSIADYLERYNNEKYKHLSYYNGPNDSSVQQPVEEEIIIEDAPIGEHLIPNLPLQNQLPIHKDSSAHNNRKGTSKLFIHSTPGNKQLQEEHPSVYYNHPDYEASDDSSGGREIDPELIILYEKVLKEYNKYKKLKLNESKRVFVNGNVKYKQPFHKKNDESYSRDYKKHVFNLPGNERKQYFVINKEQNTKQIIFPGPMQVNNNRPQQHSSFQASPPFHTYSEPDPLYHPNKNPFETSHYVRSQPNTVEVPVIGIMTISPLAQTTIPITTNEQNIKFPNSINAQLPPSKQDDITNIFNNAETAVSPKHPQKTTYKTDSIRTTVTRHSSTTANKNDENVNTAQESSTISNSQNTAANFIEGNVVSHNSMPATEQTDFFFLPTAKTTDETESLIEEKPYPSTKSISTEGLIMPTTFRRNYTLPISSTHFPDQVDSEEQPGSKPKYNDSTSNELNRNNAIATEETIIETSASKIYEGVINWQNSSNNNPNGYFSTGIPSKTEFKEVTTQMVTPVEHLSSTTINKHNHSLNSTDDNEHLNMRDKSQEHIPSTEYAYTNSPSNYSTQNTNIPLSSEIKTHYIMAIINQARTYEILSSNNSNNT